MKKIIEFINQPTENFYGSFCYKKDYSVYVCDLMFPNNNFIYKCTYCYPVRMVNGVIKPLY